MKILHINSNDINGGAARAAYRLHQALLIQGVDSQMLVQVKSSNDYTVIGPQTKGEKILAKLRPTLDAVPVRRYKERSKTLFSPGWVPFSKIVERINMINPDVVHLHWITGGMMRIEDLAKINAPIVWSLHDDWAFTGGCHIKWECEGYKYACGSCPRLSSTKKNDLSRKVFQRKVKTFSKIHSLKIVGLSHWLAGCAKESSLFKNREVINLPNLLNINLYAPFDKTQARSLLKLPIDKKLVLFGAVNAISDINKGFKELSKALTQVDKENTELVVFGNTKPKSSQGFKQKVHYLGHLHDDVSLRLLYNAADVMVVPSLQENLSNAIMESLACGTPVVGFDIGGNSDLIDHELNGFLAKPFDVTQLAKGIQWVCNNSDSKFLANNARIKVLKHFDSNIVVKKYIELYRNIY